MKSQKRFCKRCEQDTYHDIKKGLTPNMTGTFERVFFAIGTLGFSELETDTYATCQRCERTTTIA